jgi:hypothetical protein
VYASYVALSSNIPQPPVTLWGWAHNKKEVETQAAFHMLKFLEQNVGDNRVAVPQARGARSSLIKAITLSAQQSTEIGKLVSGIDFQESSATTRYRRYRRYRASSRMVFVVIWWY